MNKKHIGSSFDDFLKEEGIFEEVEAMATKKIMIMDLLETMEKQKLNKSQMAQKMHTSRSVVDKLLNNKSSTLKLTTLQKAARVLRKKVIIKLA